MHTQAAAWVKFNFTFSVLDIFPPNWRESPFHWQHCSTQLYSEVLIIHCFWLLICVCVFMFVCYLTSRLGKQCDSPRLKPVKSMPSLVTCSRHSRIKRLLRFNIFFSLFIRCERKQLRIFSFFCWQVKAHHLQRASLVGEALKKGLHLM